MDKPNNQELENELYKKYAGGSINGRVSWFRRLRYVEKKLLWVLLIDGTYLVKRVIDVTVALVALVLLSPLFLIVSVLIKATDGGPVFFSQTRVGRWGKEFPCPKFRSMVLNAEALKKELLKQNDHQDSITFKMKKDPRITWIGRIIRKLSIDELPQLWSVFIGQMSLVGPRPPVPSEVEKYTLAQRKRLDVIPGLTCIWQVQGRGDIPFDQQVQLDVQYINSQSLWLDLKLLLQTVPAVLLGKGAY